MLTLADQLSEMGPTEKIANEQDSRTCAILHSRIGESERERELSLFLLGLNSESEKVRQVPLPCKLAQFTFAGRVDLGWHYLYIYIAITT